MEVAEVGDCERQGEGAVRPLSLTAQINMLLAYLVCIPHVTEKDWLRNIVSVKAPKDKKPKE